MLEARLFDRLSRDMQPNELGLFTLRYAHSALDGHRKFVDEGGPRGRNGIGRKNDARCQAQATGSRVFSLLTSRSRSSWLLLLRFCASRI